LDEHRHHANDIRRVSEPQPAEADDRPPGLCRWRQPGAVATAVVALRAGQLQSLQANLARPRPK